MLNNLVFIELIALPVLILSTSLIPGIFEEVTLWQRKEYRLDRMLSHIKHNSENTLRNRWYYFIRFVLLIALFLFQGLSYFEGKKIILICYVCLIFRNLISTINLSRPSISIRNLLILAGIGVIDLLLLRVIFREFAFAEQILSFPNRGIPLNSFLISILILDMAQSAIVAFFVLATEPLALFKRRRTIETARKKLNKFPNLKTIGITGSFGKTTTKEMLKLILSSEYKVAITPENRNTSVGIAESILSEIKSDSEIFIAEMGAYKAGEIRDCTKLLPLDIAIVTTVGNSHLDIFGSVENIAVAKYEIIEGLKPEGLAILNADNEHTLAMQGKTSHKSILFSQRADNANKSNLVAVTNVIWNNNKVTFDIEYQSKKTSLTTTIVGKHLFANLVAALTCALTLNFKLDELKNLLKNLRFQSSHFQILSKANNITIIDDSYNSNSGGFIGAVSELASVKADSHILITKGIQETGSEIQKIYKTLAEQVSKIINTLITTDPLLADEVRNHKDVRVCLVQTNPEMPEQVQKHIKADTAILVEGRVHPSVSKFLNSL